MEMNNYNPDIHHRRSIRLKGYDYSKEGLYFITIRIQNRLCLFGKITNGQMILNDAGKMVDKVWNEIPLFYKDFEIDTFQIMPDHIHGIISIVPETPETPETPVGAGPRACPFNSNNNTIKQTPMTGLITGQPYAGRNHRGLPLRQRQRQCRYPILCIGLNH